MVAQGGEVIVGRLSDCRRRRCRSRSHCLDCIGFIHANSRKYTLEEENRRKKKDERREDSRDAILLCSPTTNKKKTEKNIFLVSTFSLLVHFVIKVLNNFI